MVNGEIYNHQELRGDLEKRGHRFRSHSDSEVVVHLYEEVGDRVPELLRGMFALAIYDARTRRLLLARDRFGEKPLYYTQRPDGFAFASELAALLSDPGTDADVSPAAVDLYLSLQYVPAPHSIFRQVQKLPAGCLLQVACGGEARVRRYYQISYQPTLHALGEKEAGGARAGSGRGCGSGAPHVRRALGRVPFGWSRFLHCSGVHGARERPASANLLSGFRGRRGG